MTSILIAGVGNIFCGDDAFGCEAVRRLHGRPSMQDVRIIDFGIRGFDLAYALMDEQFDVTIMVDALQRGGVPGTIYTIEADLESVQPSEEDPGVETHGMNPMKVFQLVKAMGGQFRRVYIVGCEPETLGPEEGLMGLSQAVEASLDEAVRQIETLVVFLRDNELNEANTFLGT